MIFRSEGMKGARVGLGNRLAPTGASRVRRRPVVVAVAAGVVVVVLLLVAAWLPSNEVVARVQTSEGPPPSANVESWLPGEVLLERETRFFGLREEYELWAGHQVEQEGGELRVGPVLCGYPFDVDLAQAGDPPVLADLRWTGVDFEVEFGSGHIMHLPAHVMDTCR